MEQEIAQTGEEVVDAAGPVDSVNETSMASEDTRHDQVPVSALQAERQQRQALQEKLRLLEDHVALIQANQQGSKADPADDLSDDDVLTVGEAKRFMNEMQSRYQTGIDELRISQKYSDYNQVVKDYLPKVIEKNPALKATLQNDPNRYELAYYLAKNSDEYRSSKSQVKKSADAERIVQNAQRAGSLSAVGSTTPQGKPSGFRNMSDDEFMKLANRNRGAF